MKIVIDRVNENFHLKAQNEEGAAISMDATVDVGGNNLGLTPMQLLLAGAGGCSAIDVISILKKQKQVITSFRVEVVGDKEKVDHHSEWKKIHLRFIIEGEIEKEKAQHALDLSMEKYCSVSKSLQPKSSLSWEMIVNGI
jgi:putative redox protein